MHMRVFVMGLVFVALTFHPLPARATNGYFSHGFGTASKGMAGAGVALPLDSMAPATNPAAIVFVDPGWDIGVGLFSPDREYNVAGQPSGFPGTFGLAPGTVRSGSRLFPIPHGGVVWKSGAKGAFGLALYGNGGMNTSYDAPTFGVAPAGVDLSQMFLAPTYAIQFGERHAVGVTGLIGYQRFEARGLQAFGAFSMNSSALTDRDHSQSFGVGVRLGYIGRLTKHLSVGASYQSKVWMSEFSKYEGLFAGQGDFDVPSNWVVGVALMPTEAVDIVVDVQQVRYSEVDAVGNRMLPNMMQAPLGAATGAGFGWDDMTTVKLGLQIRGHGGVTWRGGYSYGNQPIPESEVLFNILAPGVMEQHATFGLSKELVPGKSIGFSVMHALRSRVEGPNPLEVPGLQRIELQMKQWEFEVGYSVKF